jgi:hypothetical protein
MAGSRTFDLMCIQRAMRDARVHVPTSSVVACSETASCARLEAVKRCISGTRPTEDTVTWQPCTGTSSCRL